MCFRVVFLITWSNIHLLTTDWGAPLSKWMHSLASDINRATSPKSWETWRRRWQDSNYRLCQYIPEPSAKPPGHDLKQHQWVLLNRVHSGCGWYASFMHQIGLSDNPNRICGEIQTHQHVFTCCIYIYIYTALFNVPKYFGLTHWV